MRVVASALLLSACASGGTGRYLMVMDSHHGPAIMGKFKTIEACQEASRGSDPTFTLRCTTAKAEQRRRREVLETYRRHPDS
jgi:hypothetical protein